MRFTSTSVQAALSSGSMALTDPACFLLYLCLEFPPYSILLCDRPKQLPNTFTAYRGEYHTRYRLLHVCTVCWRNSEHLQLVKEFSGSSHRETLSLG